MSKKRNRKMSQKAQEAKARMNSAPALDSENSVKDIEAKPEVFDEKNVAEAVTTDSGIVTENTVTPSFPGVPTRIVDAFAEDRAKKAAAQKTNNFGAKEHKGSEGVWVNVNEEEAKKELAKKEAVAAEAKNNAENEKLAKVKTNKQHKAPKIINADNLKPSDIDPMLEVPLVEMVKSTKHIIDEPKETSIAGALKRVNDALGAKENFDDVRIISMDEIEDDDVELGGDVSEAEYKLMCHLVSMYGYDNPKPMTPEQLKAKNVHPEFRNHSRIVLTTKFINYSIKATEDSAASFMMPIIRRQQTFMEKAINSNGRVMYYQTRNNPAFMSGCMFSVGTESTMPIIAGGSEAKISIFIKPENFKEFIEMFAVGTVVTVPCSNELDDDAIEAIVNNQVVTEAVPYIQLDMNALFDYMCEYYNTDDNGIEDMCINKYKLGMFELYEGAAWPSSLNACKYGVLNRVPKTPTVYESVYDMVTPRWMQFANARAAARSLFGHAMV